MFQNSCYLFLNDFIITAKIDVNYNKFTIISKRTAILKVLKRKNDLKRLQLFRRMQKVSNFDIIRL